MHSFEIWYVYLKGNHAWLNFPTLLYMYPFLLCFLITSVHENFEKSRESVDTKANSNARILDKTISHLTEICVALTGKVRDRRVWKGFPRPGFHATTCTCETEVDLPNSLKSSIGWLVELTTARTRPCFIVERMAELIFWMEMNLQLSNCMLGVWASLRKLQTVIFF